MPLTSNCKLLQVQKPIQQSVTKVYFDELCDYALNWVGKTDVVMCELANECMSL